MLKIVSIALCFLLIGCAQTGNSSGSLAVLEQARQAAISSQHQEIIAVDMVSLLIQLPSTSPFYTTVQVAQPKNEFGKHILSALEKSGYGIQRVAQDQGRNHVTYRMNATEGGNTANVSVVLTINNLQVKRRYAIRGDAIQPSTEFEVTGVEPSMVLLNTSLFTPTNTNVDIPNAVIFKRSNGVTTGYSRSKGQFRLSKSASGSDIQAARALIRSRAAIFTLDRMSDDSEALRVRDFIVNKRLILSFEAEGLHLGRDNKQAIKQLIAEFNEDEELLLVVGCRHGKSLIWDGSESQSLSRQQRVKTEVLAYGIPISRVKEEGCFRGQYHQDLEPGLVMLYHMTPKPNYL